MIYAKGYIHFISIPVPYGISAKYFIKVPEYIASFTYLSILQWHVLFLPTVHHRFGEVAINKETVLLYLSINTAVNITVKNETIAYGARNSILVHS